MPSDRFEWLDKIKAVEREHVAARLAFDRLLRAVQQDPTLLNLEGIVRLRDIQRAADRLDATYLIRLFAEAEAGLRAFWATRRDTEPPASQLLDSLAGSCRVPSDYLANAHAVREHRNDLVHERNEARPPIDIPEARGHLCRFFSFLPLTW